MWARKNNRRDKATEGSYRPAVGRVQPMDDRNQSKAGRDRTQDRTGQKTLSRANAKHSLRKTAFSVSQEKVLYGLSSANRSLRPTNRT